MVLGLSNQYLIATERLFPQTLVRFPSDNQGCQMVQSLPLMFDDFKRRVCDDFRMPEMTLLTSMNTLECDHLTKRLF